MEKLIEKVENLKTCIQNEEVVIEFLKAKKNVFNDNSLIEKIEKYHLSFDNQLKNEIITSPSFLAYKEKETNINLLILDINQKFKKCFDNSDYRNE